MIPIIFVIIAGRISRSCSISFQRHEILLTILQIFLDFLLLKNMELQVH